jgi:hypothetical protein
VAGLAKAEPVTEYLSDVVQGIATFTGTMGIDTTPYRVWPEAIKGKPIRIKDENFSKGIGIDAPGHILVSLDNAYERFEAKVGIQWQGNPVGTATFKVFVDGQLQFDSGVMHEADPAKPVSLSLNNAKEMRLVVEGSGMCNWADAKLTPSASAADAFGSDSVDMAPFARVVTFDPNRMNGTVVDRLTEIPAEEIFFDTDVRLSADGNYTVPVNKNGLGCIGLQWIESRRIRDIGIEFAKDSHIPSTAEVRAECWVGLGVDHVSGESNWQGNWKPLPAKIEQNGNTWVVKSLRETRKIRWVFPKSDKPIIIRRLFANTISHYKTADVMLQLEEPMPGKHAEVEIYNGEILEPSGVGRICKWDLSAPLHLKVNYTTPQQWALDRTVLRVKLPNAAFGVAIDDLLPDEFPLTPGPQASANLRIRAVDDVVDDLYKLGCVYVKDYGFFATADPAKITLAQYKEKIKGRKTILEQVRQMPDQSWSQAVEKLYLDAQSNCPTLISLAWDNRKVVVDRAGTVHYGPMVLDYGQFKSCFEITPRFGSCSDAAADASFSRKLDNGWMPMPHISVKNGGVIYQQLTFVAPFDKSLLDPNSPWLYKRPICVAEYTIENPQDTAAAASMKLSFLSDNKTGKKAQLQSLSGRVLAMKQNQVLAVVDIPVAGALAADANDGVLTLTGTVPAKSQIRFCVYIPLEWPLNSEDQAMLAGGTKLRKAAEEYWREVMKPAMEIDIPDTQLRDLILGSQVHCLNAARSEEEGKLVEAFIAATVYGSLDSESHGIIRGMDFMGQHDFAKRALNYFVKRENPAGYFSHGYTLMGTGQHMSGLSQHYWLTGDETWFKGIEPKLAKMCEWMQKQSEKTKQLDLDGQKVPEYGLQLPGTVADWQHWGYTFCGQSHYYQGIRNASRTLAEANYPDAARFVQFADSFRDEIKRAFDWTQQRTPVVPLRDGTWVPGSPYEVYTPGPVQQFFPNYTIRLYDEILGSHHLVSQGVLNSTGRHVDWIMDYLEDIVDLRDTFYRQPKEYHLAKKTDPFNWGGVQKFQPYYMRNLEVYAARDDVKPFIRAYFNTAASVFNKEDMSFWEGNWTIGAWDKTAETGNFLYQTKLMFVMERGSELWLAPFVANNWLKDGMQVAVSKAPTKWGPVAYRIKSYVNNGYIEAEITPPNREMPREIVIRLRHPEGKRISSVKVDGRKYSNFDRDKETITLTPTKKRIVVRAIF